MTGRAGMALTSLLAAAVTALAVLAPGPDGRAAGDATAPARPFAPGSFWNARLAPDAPLDPRSAALVLELGRQVRTHGPWINTVRHSTPVYVVGKRRRRVRVRVDAPSALFTGAADAAAVRRQLRSVPIPRRARGAAGVNRHIVVWQPSTDTAWELWNAHRVPAEPCAWHRHGLRGWHAAWGAQIAGVSGTDGAGMAPGGATASGLPLLGGLVRLGEWRAGRIDHALAMAIPDIQRGGWVWPATRTDGRHVAPNAIPMGTRFRLDPAVDVERLDMPPAGKALARAAQEYGIVVRDHADEAVVFYGEDPTRFGPDPYPALFSGMSPGGVLANFPWGRLQVLAPP
jgi:hypothetical protein